MDIGKLVAGTAGYTICTFVLAIVWHVVLFEESYRSFGYFEGEPNFLIGLVTILLQGMLLSILFPMMNGAPNSFRRGLEFASLAGAFFWTSHVLAFVAKQEVPGAWMFVGMETVYLVLQFGVFGMLLGAVHRGRRTD